MSFPARRLRRLRRSEKIRELLQETRLSPKDFICPIFVQENLEKRQKVESMPDIERLPLNEIVREVGAISDLDIPAVMVFGLPSKKMMRVLQLLMKRGLCKKQFLKLKKTMAKKWLSWQMYVSVNILHQDIVD